MKKNIAKVIKLKRNLKKVSFKKTHLLLSIFFAIQAVIVGFFNGSHYYPITVNFLNKDPLLSGDGQTVLSSATRNIMTIDIMNLVMAALIIAALYHLALATIFAALYKKTVKSNSTIFTWIDFVINGNLVMLILVLSLGIYDLSSLILLAVLTGVVGFMNYLSTNYIKGFEVFTKNIYRVSCSVWAVIWFVMAVYIWNTVIISTTQLAGYIFLILLGVLIISVAQILSTKLFIGKKAKWGNIQFYTKFNLVSRVIMTSLVVWAVFFGIK